MKHTTNFVLLVSALITLMLINGCADTTGVSNQLNENQREQPLSFTVMYAGGDNSHKMGISSIIADFERSHPNIIIEEMNDTWSGTYAEQLKLKDAVGEFPDLVEVRDTQMFADAGLIAEMPRQLTDKFPSVPLINGKIYNTPMALPFPNGIIYNKKMFHKAGIHQTPKTWEAFLEACQKLKKHGMVPLVVGGKDGWHMSFWVNKFLIDDVYIHDPNWNAKRNRGEVSWTDPGPTRAMKKLVLLWEQKNVSPGFITTADNQVTTALVSGEAAMLYSGPWMFRQLAIADPDFEFGFFALPDEQGHVNVATLPLPNGWSMSTQSAQDPEKRKIITQFLHFFYSNEEYPKYLNAVGGISATNTSMASNHSEAMQEVLKIMKDPDVGQSRQMNMWWGENELPPRFRNWFYDLTREMVTGNISVEAAMKQADQKWDTELRAVKHQP
ncbi:ABC transporter substrate-binding protein [Paenibacillus maysiensis]|uniref:ABC transporter substrate-binding protein n=1 Tax=Paenibacillus maysiensis TaxID=1155954 RepID=UPI00046F4401|nr:extracellular solute-binding protein [Paenibacillus maysiensis]